MKKILLCLIIALPLFTQAQIVTIPDVNLKNALVNSTPGNYTAKNSAGNYIAVDTNNDGQIQVSEALNIWALYISEKSIISISGLEAFTNLRVLRMSENPILDINIAFLQNLEEFHGGSSYNVPVLNSLNIAGITTLKRLSLFTTNLTTLDLTGLVNLESVNIQDNYYLTTLDLTVTTKLKGVNLYENNLSSINIAGQANLTDLNVSANQNLAVLDITGCVKLKNLSCMGTKITSLTLHGSPLLEDVQIGGNYLTTLNVGYLPKLTYLRFYFAKAMTSVDLSGCPILNTLDLSSTEMSFVNLKNGPKVTSIDGWAEYFCVDENEMPYYQTVFANYSNVQVGSYCTFTPGGNFNTITGNFNFDQNNLGCTIVENYRPFVKVLINDGSQNASVFSNHTGNYNFYTQAGNFTLTPQFENNWFTATPASATVNFANSNNNTSTQNFCVVPNGVHPDVEVVLVPSNDAQPGFDARYQIVFKNKGNQTLSGNVVLNYNEAILDYIAIGSTTPTSTANGQLTWAYNNLLPFESRTINVVLNLNGPMETPPVNNGDMLNYTVSITPSTGDETPADNTFVLNQVVTGSFDPNDITCLEGDNVHPDKIGGYLHYNINFENTGTAPATFIVVKDVINTQQFDINRLQMMYSSHNVETRINGNKVEFFFDDINLGPLAKGNVVFKIKTKPTVAVNSTVMNKAEIFFDYNWPIVTNEAETIFAVLSSGNFAVDNSVSIYPNPAITTVNIKASTEIKSVQLYDVQGRLLMVTKEATLDVSGRASGIYFVKIITEKGMKVEKLVRK